MPKIRPGVSTQNYAAKEPHKVKPMPELPHKPPKLETKKPAGIPANRGSSRGR